MGTINEDAGEGEQYFLWLSDIHFDPHYSTSKAFQSSSYKNAGCKSDDAIPMGKYGCDSTRHLVQSALEYGINITSARTPSKPAFVIVSGDSIRHGVNQLFNKHDFNEGGEARSNNATAASAAVEEAANSSYHVAAMNAAGEILNDAVTMIKDAFPDTEVIVSVGNNDIVPDYYLRLQDESAPLGKSNLTPEVSGMVGVLFNALSNNAEGSTATKLETPMVLEETPKKAILTARDGWTYLRGGYYSRTVHNGSLTILSLNTILYSGYFSPAPQNDMDPGWQFTWMKQVLSNCRDNGTQAIIVGHIPPAVGSYRHTQLWDEMHIQTYYDIVKEFDEVIIGQLFGHLHSDEFRVGLNEDGDLSMIPTMNTPLLLGPSITPLHGNDPSIRLVKYGRLSGDGKTQNGKYRLLDYDSYRYPIGSETGRSWSKLYTFSEAYDVASTVIQDEGLSSEVFKTIAEAMEDIKGKESTLMESYRSFMLSGADGDVATSSSKGANVECDLTCRNEMMCTFYSATRGGYDRCLLERKQVWTTNGRSIFGLVGAVVFATVMISLFVIKRCRKRRAREDYESTPSVTGNVRNDDDVEKDQEMI